MNKLFNWTFGSVFRTIGRVIGYLVVGALLGLILQKNGVRIRDLFPTLKVSAKVFSTSEEYRVYKCDSGNDYENCNFTSWTNNGTATSNSPSSKVVRGYCMNFAQNETLSQGGVYRVSIDFKTTPKSSNNQTLESYSCFGVNSNSTSGGLNENIQSCELQTIIPTSDGVRYIFNVVPSVNIKSIKINIYLNTGYGATSITGLKSSTLSNDTSTSDAINNQTNELLDNQNQNTSDIINNQNQNTQNIIDNQNELLGSKCENIFQFNLIQNGSSYIGLTATKKSNGVYNFKGTATGEWLNLSNVSYFSSNQYFFANSKTTTNNFYVNNNSSQIIIYDSSNSLTFIHLTIGQYYDFNVPFTISQNNYINSYCEYGTYLSKLDDTNNAINGLNDTINNDDVTSSQSEASNFFGNFTTNTHGLTGIITAPLNAIQSLTSKTCSPLVLPLPFVNQNLTLPCMRQIYTDNFGGFMQLYDVIVVGIIAYWICVRIFGLVKDFKNPDHDEIEVVDL